MGELMKWLTQLGSNPTTTRLRFTVDYEFAFANCVMFLTSFVRDADLCPAFQASSRVFATGREFLCSFAFATLAEAQQVIDRWREDCNRVRPHSCLGNRTLSELMRELNINIPELITTQQLIE